MSIWCVSDLHGRLDLWEKANRVLLQDTDVICFLGDAVDRGPDGWKLLETLMKDPRVIFLKGNHEDMLAKALTEIKDNNYQGRNFYLYLSNGGKPTLEQWSKLSGKNFSIIEKINRMPTNMIYINKQGFTCLLSHSGYSLDDDMTDEQTFIWNRSHFAEFWDEEHRPFDIMVHGHTPCVFVEKYVHQTWNPEDGALWYCDGHKVDIDCGSYITGITTFLNLDTFEETIISDKSVFN